MNKLKIVSLGGCNHLYLNQTKKFKSIGIKVVYKLKYDYKNVSYFNILAKYLGNCNQNYPSIEKCNQYVDSLYGSNVGIKTNFSNDLFTISFYINFINPKYVMDDLLIEQAVSFLHDLIYKPLINEDGFDKTIFEICKSNCLVDVESLDEYSLSYVYNQVKKQFCERNYAMAMSTLGNKRVLKYATEKNAVKYYQKLIHSPYDIYVNGEYNLKKMETLLQKYFYNKYNKSFSYSPIKLIPYQKFDPIHIQCNVQQASLVVAYHIPILLNDVRQYAFKILKVILCGNLSSKFNKVIRERLGLCYYINAQYSSLYGKFYVMTGIDSKNISKVLEQIKQQINQVCKGKITKSELKMAKMVLINDLKSTDDALFGRINMIESYHQINKEFDLKEEINHYKNVCKEDVMEVCKLLTFCGYGVLSKESI